MQRRQLLDALTRADVGQDASRPLTVLFRLLYGLPAGLQLEAASFLLGRYLPKLEETWPGLAWPRELLGDPEAWLRRQGRRLPDEPAKAGPADAAFRFGLDALLLAASSLGDPRVLTSSCCVAVGAAIDAHRFEAWAASDPDGLALWRDLGEIPEEGSEVAPLTALDGRSAYDNPAARAAAEREWLALHAWLEARQVFAYPEEAEPLEVERDLAAWEEREMSLLTPLPPGL